MRRLLIGTALLLLALSLSAPAQATRVTTLGNNNMILLDNSNMSLFPSRLWDYPNMAVAELDDAEVGSLGVHWKAPTSTMTPRICCRVR